MSRWLLIMTTTSHYYNSLLQVTWYINSFLMFHTTLFKAFWAATYKSLHDYYFLLVAGHHPIKDRRTLRLMQTALKVSLQRVWNSSLLFRGTPEGTLESTPGQMQSIQSSYGRQSKKVQSLERENGHFKGITKTMQWIAFHYVCKYVDRIFSPY